MSRSAAHRLRDIIRAAELASQHAGGLDAQALAELHGPRDAALFRIAIIGEAISHLPADVQALAPEIPWHRIKGMRNHIIHAYWQIDLTTIAQTMALRLDLLTAASRRLVEMIERDE